MVKKFVCSRTEPIVQTKQGLLRGYKYGDMYHFNGVKYADSDRFQMPRPVQPWEGVREAQLYGYSSKVLDPYPVDQNLIVPHRYWHESEDCQYLNIWTTELSETARKPVMVWIHGGGYSNGSALEHVDYDGENLARYGDVVVVSINHRLNIIGYLDLSSFDDEKYHNSANVGNADLVACLAWIQENIAAFGGDPGNVTIFGQSGGGGKVANLLQTPAAAGLFHKAIIESGIGDMMTATPMDGHAVAVAMLEHMGLTEADYEQLAVVPYEKLAEAFNAVAPKLEADGVNLFWGPKPNDWYIGDMPTYGICEHAKHIPVMVGSVFAEFMMKYEPEPEKLTEAQHLSLVEQVFGSHTGEVVEAFKAAYPDKPLCYAAIVDNVFRAPSLRYMKSWLQQAEAPIYSWLLSYCFDYMGTYPTWHCAEIPLAFHNIDLIEVYGSEDCEKLQEEVSGAWVAFARTGNPNHDGLIHWPAYDASRAATMVFDKQTTVRDNYDQQLMDLLDAYKPPFSLKMLHSDEEDEVAHPY